MVEPHQRAASTDCPRRLNGNTPHVEGSSRNSTHGATSLRSRWRTTRCAGKRPPNQLAARSKTRTAYMTSAQTFMNGARTGLMRGITASRRNGTPRVPPRERAGRRAADRGGTTRKCRDALRGRASLLNSSTQITAFEWPPIFRDEVEMGRHLRTHYGVGLEPSE